MRIPRILVGLSLLACLLAAAPTHAATIKIGTLSPAGSAWMNLMQAGAAEVEKATQGRVSFKFYPGGVMGDENTMLRKIRIGQLQGGAFTSGTMLEAYPDLRVYGLPMTFRSYEEVDFVRQALDSVLAQGMEKAGFACLGLADGGFAYVMSQYPIRTIPDLSNRKVWVPNSDALLIKAVTTFGFTPIPLSLADVRTALSTGMIDTIGASPVGALALQWHTQVKYLTDVPLLQITGILAIDLKALKALSPEDEKAVREIMGRAFQEIDRRNRQDNLGATAALKKQGIQFIHPEGAELQEWYAKATEAAAIMIKSGQISPAILAALQERLKAFRGN